MIKAFIFDLGNVIVPFETDAKRKALRKMAPHASFEITDSVLLSEEMRLFERGLISKTDFFDFVKKILVSEAVFEDFSAHWNGIFLPQAILSEDFIGALAAKYKMLILSDTDEIHFEFIRRNFPVLRFFDEFVLSYEAGVLKPAPEIFEIAVRRAGCRAEECFFTDDLEKNVEAAARLGISAVRFESAKQFENHLRKLKLL